MRDFRGTINIYNVNIDNLNKTTQKRIISQLKEDDDSVDYEVVSEKNYPINDGVEALLKECGDVLDKLHELLTKMRQ